MTPQHPRVTRPGRWADLAQRVGSALVILALGIALLMAPPRWSDVGLAALFGALVWELARLVLPADVAQDAQIPVPRPRPGENRMAVAIAAVAGAVMAAVLSGWTAAALCLALPAALGWRIAAPPLRAAFLAQLLLLALATAGLAWVRATHGQGTAWWIVLLVVQSDVLGYFVGRSVGGPKFWPAVSPKKTWSGTAAGWLGAAAVGAVLLAAGRTHGGALVAGPLLVLGGQLGDIGESWLKRRAGVKDASGIIPGHGGLMDRFDAMSGALATALVLGLAGLLPSVGA